MKCFGTRRSGRPTTGTVRPVSGEAGFGFHHVDLGEALNIFMRDFGAMGGFETIFGGGRRSRTDERRGQDIKVTVRLSLSDVALGAKKTVKLKGPEQCKACQGRRRQARNQDDRLQHLRGER